MRYDKVVFTVILALLIVVIMFSNVNSEQKSQRGIGVEYRKIDGISVPTDIKYYALVIGIDKYRNFETLKTAASDANTIAQILQDNYNFYVTKLIDEDATRANIYNEINDFRKKLRKEDRLLIYFAGHGNFDKDMDRSFWFPVDAEKDNPTNWFSAEDISSQLKIIPSQHIIIIADSCYSGTLTREASVKLSTNEERNSYLNNIINRKARIQLILMQVNQRRKNFWKLESIVKRQHLPVVLNQTA
jgi:hypothetical protein